MWKSAPLTITSGPRPHKLETTSYVVRTLAPQDASENWLRWSRDPEIMNPINTPLLTMTRDQLMAYISGFDQDKRWLFGIFDKATRAHIGIHQISVSKVQRTATFNVLVGEKEFWGRNVVLETRAALLDFFFDKVGIEKAIGQPLARNFPMIFNYRKQGWTLEGVLRGHCRAASGEGRIDQYQFGLLREDWKAIRAEQT